MMHGSCTSIRVAAAIALAFSVGTTSGCGDEAATEYTLSLSVSDPTLTADGSDSTTVRVMVLDQRGYPPPVGSTVLIQAPNADVNASGGDTGTSQTDVTGTAQFSIACTSENDVQVLARYEEFRGVLLQQVTCAPPPAGDWQLLLGASPRSVEPSGTATITVDAIQGDGSPVPAGTGLALSIREPNPGARFRVGAPTRQVLATPDASGRVSTVVVAPEVQSSFSVCVEFVDQRFGEGQRCVTVQVGTRVIDRATCLGSYTPSRISGDGESTSLLTFTVYDDTGQTVSGAEIDAIIGRGEFLEDPADPFNGFTDVLLTTDITGSAEVTILAPNGTGTADVEAIATFDGLTEPLECEFLDSLVFYPPPTCAFEEIGTLDLGASRSVRVCFTDFDAPVAAGRRVDFELVSSVGGTALTASTAFTDASGCATTGIATGQTPGGVTIRASLEFGEGESVCQSDATIQRGGLESANQLVVSCGFRNIGAYLRRAGMDIMSSCGTICQANVTDQFHNPVEGAAVYFSSEAGSIEAVGITNSAGIASVTFSSRGWAPADVPTTGAESAGPGGGTMNPRDSAATIIAWTVGQEMFNDANGNGVYDEGEYFIDIGEPFVDADDDDVYTPGGSHETFTDVAVPGRELNGEYDGANGIWDAYTQIWGTTRIVYSGGAVVNDQTLTFSGAPVPDPITMSGVLSFRPVDVFGNGLSSATTFNATTNCSRAEIDVAERTWDSWGVVHFARIIRNFAAGVEISPEESTAEYGQIFTELSFGFSGPAVDIAFNVTDDGEAENCQISLSWTEGGTSACADGAIEWEMLLPVSLPESAQ
jgi:hypothetical protein